MEHEADHAQIQKRSDLCCQADVSDGSLLMYDPSHGRYTYIDPRKLKNGTLLRCRDECRWAFARSSAGLKEIVVREGRQIGGIRVE